MKDFHFYGLHAVGGAWTGCFIQLPLTTSFPWGSFVFACGLTLVALGYSFGRYHSAGIVREMLAIVNKRDE